MTGQYAHNIDAKGRLFIPARLREELGQTFHVTVGLDHCLSIYSDESWATFTDKVRALPYSKAKALRPLFANARCTGPHPHPHQAAGVRGPAKGSGGHRQL